VCLTAVTSWAGLSGRPKRGMHSARSDGVLCRTHIGASNVLLVLPGLQNNDPDVDSMRKIDSAP